jgi:DNA-binding XRE family transcriptional regulator
MTQKNLAEVCGISRRTIQEIENGRVIPRFSTQRKFIQFARNVERG